MHLLLIISLCTVAFNNNVYSSPISYEDVRGTPYTVGYDHRAITINGVRTMLISGAIHYPRSTPGGMSNNTSQNMALNEKSRYQENTFCY